MKRILRIKQKGLTLKLLGRNCRTPLEIKVSDKELKGILLQLKKLGIKDFTIIPPIIKSQKKSFVLNESNKSETSNNDFLIQPKNDSKRYPYIEKHEKTNYQIKYNNQKIYNNIEGGVQKEIKISEYVTQIFPSIIPSKNDFKEKEKVEGREKIEKRKQKDLEFEMEKFSNEEEVKIEELKNKNLSDFLLSIE